MKTSTIVGLVGVLIVVGGAWYWTSGRQSAVPAPTFIINGQPVTLVNGRAETDGAPGSAEKVVTQYFGNVATGDLNGDSLPDVAFLLTQNTGGSGTFYYVVATIVAADGSYKGTDAVLLGDRIAPQTTEIRDGKLIVNYADRKAGEPMTAQPREGKSLYLKLDPVTLQFGIVVQNFEGEADASKGGYCTPEQRNADVCTADYTPVCATVQIQCITTPCDPIQETFSNSCNACKNPLVNSYLVGACK
ncbi:MAG: hypothetical protein NUV60_01660 [Patescibacteria group bacterium]|nr:hypothetical protein [Patescibacteria group bacterium]